MRQVVSTTGLTLLLLLGAAAQAMEPLPGWQTASEAIGLSQSLRFGYWRSTRSVDDQINLLPASLWLRERYSFDSGDGNSTRSLTRLLRTFFPIQASRNGLDCGLKSSAWSTQAVAGDPKRAKHIHQQPEHRISYRSLSVHWHITPQAATDR
jgi:hypothetical protein